MKISTLITIFLLLSSTIANAQEEYIATTSPTKSINMTEEELFIETYFPMRPLCKWTPGMKFMFRPDGKEMFMPIFCKYEDGKEIENSQFKEKIFEFIGTEEKVDELYVGTNYCTRFVFSCDGKKLYHEIKNMRLNDICTKDPRASISGLVYLKDIDTAREQLIGKTLYIRTIYVRVDDANSYTGYKEVTIPEYSKVTVTNVGVGSKAFPAKIIFKDEKNHSYYTEVALSRTNSGMDIKDFQADKKMKLFLNAFSFTDKNANSTEALKKKYTGLVIYPKKTLPAKIKITSEDKTLWPHIALLRYTTLHIKDITTNPSSTLATLTLTGGDDRLFSIEVNLKYDFILKNENYIEDLFGIGNLEKKYPTISAENWKRISKGEVIPGMDIEECKLALGNPIEVAFKKDDGFETWFYHGTVLEFENGRLLRAK